MEEVWKKILEKLAETVDPSAFKVWIAPLAPEEIAGTNLKLCLVGGNSFMASECARKMGSVIREAAGELLGCRAEEVCVRVRAMARPASACACGKKAAAPASSGEGTREKVRQPRPVQGSFLADLRMPDESLSTPVTVAGTRLARRIERYSFEDLVVGPSNELAVAAARDLSSTMPSVETLFLSSASGLGKTHIAQSVACRLKQERGSSTRFAYMTAEDFFTRFARGIRSHKLDDFTNQVKALDFLLLEDIQFLHGKTKTQELLASLVKHLQNHGSRVVFTSQFQPRELSCLDPQLVSLICSGIRALMAEPTFEMRKEILRSKARIHQVILPDEVADLLASRLSGDVRQLESCLQTLLLKVRILNSPLTASLAMEVLRDFAPQARAMSAAPTLDEILAFVAQSYSLSEQKLCSLSRSRDAVMARNTVFYLARKHTDMTLAQIGARVNRRHSTVIKGITAVEHEIANETPLGRQMARIIGLVEKSAGVAVTV